MVSDINARLGSAPTRATTTGSTSNQTIKTTAAAPSQPAQPIPPNSQKIDPPPRKRIIPAHFMRLEPRGPLSAINDDPLFDSEDAAKILRISEDLLKKWRQRKQGPDYIQYGQDGPVRYLLSDLKEYIVAHKICPEKKNS
jgi:hypothetical protein